MESTNLYAEHPGRIDIPLLVVASLIGLSFGLSMPVVTTASLLAEDRTFSVLGGMLSFWRAGDQGIAILILLFSVVFPFVKLGVLLWLWFVPTSHRHRRRHLRIIDPLGKWSMLDVLVVILLAGSVQLGLIADAQIRVGAYVYGAAVLASMIAASLMNQLVGPDPAYSRHPRQRSWLLPVLAAGSLALLLGGFSAPLMTVEKWLFWDEAYSIFGGILELWRAGHFAMAVAFAAFVVVLPLVLEIAQLGLALLQLGGRHGGSAVGWLIETNRWVMSDVFALALFVAIIKISNWASVVPRVGLYLFVAAVLLSGAVSVWIRWLYSVPGSGRGELASSDSES